MNAFGPYADASGYDALRRRRRWATGQQGLHGYAEYLAGGSPEIIAAETAAFTAANSGDSLLEHPIVRPIFIGVLTGACTFIVNRWLGKVFK